MVAIVTGTGHGVGRSSASTLGTAGQIGQSRVGQGDRDVYVNAASGNLVINAVDEFLVGRGPDAAVNFDFNSILEGAVQYSFSVGLKDFTGTANTAGSTVTRWTGDSRIYAYDVDRGAYVSREGGGAYDEIRFANNVWSWTDGDTGLVEYYEHSPFAGKFNLTRSVDRDGNTLTRTYSGNMIQTMATASGETVSFDWADGKIAGINELNAAGVVTRKTKLTWDTVVNFRLASITVDLTPADGSTVDGNVYVTSFTYDGSSRRVASMTQSDGSRIDVTYVQVGGDFRVATLTETETTGVGRTTSFSYDTANRITTVTDAAGQPTQLWYDAQHQLTKIVSPPATAGAAPQTQLFAYNANGDVISVTDPAGGVTTFQYDSNGNEIRREDSLGRVVTRTYGAGNELLTETVHPGSALTFGTSAAAPTVTGNKVLGTSAGGYWGGATSHQTYTGSAIVSGRRHHVANSYSFLGLSDTVMSTSAPYNEMDYAFYFYEGSITIWENGSQVAIPVPSGASDSHFCQIEYDGSRVLYRINGAVVREIAATAGRTFHAAVATTYPGSGVQDITFGTSGSTSAFATSAAAPTINGDKFVGTSGAGAWGSATSVQTYTGTASVSGRRFHSGNGYSFFGLTDAPLASSAPYNEYDYAFYFHESNIRIWENGADISVPVVGTASNDHFCEIEYDGSKVIYRINGTVVREVAASGGRTFHGGVSTSYPSSGVQDFTFVPSTPLTTRYAYDSENHLRYAINAQGEVTEYRYNAVGQRVAELVYADHSYNVAGLRAGQAITEAAMNSWVSALADKSNVRRTNTYYDVRGQVSSVVSYSALSQFGEGTESPLAITPGANATVEQQADGLYRITKTSGSSAGWDSDAHSSMKLEGDFVLRLRPGQNNKHVVAGLATKPGGSASYTNLDYGVYFLSNGPLFYMERGEHQYLGVYYNAGDNIWIARTGTTISYYKGATYEAAVAAGALRSRTGAGETLYFDSSLHDAGAVLDVGVTPRGVLNGLNTTVTPQPDGLYRVSKTSGSTANWDADARGTAKAEGDFVLRVRPSQNNAHMVGGVSTAPGAHSSFEVDYGFYFVNSGTAYWMESGYHASLGVTYNAGDDFWLVRTGTTINYYKGATLEAAIAGGTLRTRTHGGTFYFDSSFYSTGAAMDVAFTPAVMLGVNTSVAPVGDGLQRITKTSGSAANWDAEARGTAKAEGDFVLQVRPGQTYAHIVGGVSTAPDIHASFEVNYGFYFVNSGSAYWMESGYHASLGVSYNAGDSFWLVRTGTTINYYKGATLEAAMAAGTLRTRTGISGAFYADSSFYSTGAVMDMAFAPAPAPAASAAYSRTDFIYDQAGRLLSRVTEGQRPETFVYDGLGRLIASTDRNQGSTSVVFNDAAGQTVMTLANGVVKTATYNKAGNLVSLAESGGGIATATTTNKYDRLGRLRMTTDATGFNKYFVYDKAGRLVAEVNHRGDMFEYRYDANDRVIAIARYFNGVTGANLAALADPNSTLEISAVRPTWHPWDIWNWRTYDKEGRLTSTMDGTIRTYEYDSAGRLIKTVAYHNGITWDQAVAFQANPPTAPVIPAADPRDSVSRNFYDKAGQLIAVLDGEGYLTRNSYDKAGRLVEKIAYATATAATDRLGTLSKLLASQAAHANDRVVRFVYDGQGQLRYEIDALNQVTEYRYNGAGQSTSTIRHAGSIAAPADYRIATIKAAVEALSAAPWAVASRRTWSVYDEAGRVAYAIGAEGAVTRFSYDTMGQVTKTVEFAALRATTSAPDLTAMNNWAAGQNGNAANRVTRNFYSARGDKLYTVDGEGFVSRTDYDASGRVTGEFRWDDAFAINDSTTIDNVRSATDNSTRWGGNWYAYEYGGPLTDHWNGEGNWTRYAYYQNGTQMYEYAPYGGANPTYFNYDIWGRVTTRSDTGVVYGRDGLGNDSSFTDGRGLTTTRTFDHLGRVKTETDAAGGVVSYEYNAFGEVTKVTDARGNATTSTYDRLGRLLTTTDALNNVTTYSYNEFGDLRTVTRGTAVTTFDYDRAGRVTRTTDAEGHYEEYTLDAFGNRINVRNKIGGNIVNSFDRRGLLVAETLPMASHDNLGNVVAWTVTNKFEYDGRRNRTKKIEAFGLAEQRTTTYYYDKADRLVETAGDYVQAIDQASHSALSWVIPTEKLKYDQRGRLIERIDALGARTLYYYDGLGRVIVELAANGAYTAFTYDGNGNVLTKRNYATAVAMPAAAGGTPPAAPGGEYRETSHTYDALNRLKTSTVANVRTGAWNGSYYATGVGSVTTTYDYDSNGNLIKTTDGNGGIAFSFYDKLNRKIASVDAENYLTFYTLDGEGNVTQEERFAARLGFGVSTAHDAAWLRSTVAGNAGDRITQFGYDKNGRRTSEWRLYINSNYVASGGGLGADGTHGGIQYQYNGLGQVWQKTFGNGDYVSFVYDATGRLTQESRSHYVDMNGASVRPTTFYYYNGVNNLTLSRQGGLTQSGGDRLTRYTYGAGGRLATMTDATGSTYNYFYDAAGNVLRENYQRTRSDGGSATEGLLYTRDLRGRVTSQALATWVGYWAKGDSQDTEYNVYGDVSRRGVNGLWQEQFAYDGAGRVWRSNSGDGVWRFFVHDGNGNQTLTIESEGSNLAGYTIDQALSAATAGGAYYVGGAYIDGINSTINVFDKRGQAVQTRMPQRQLNDTAAATGINVSRTYTAFGEVASETDARGYTTDYLYNTMGRLTEKRSPGVNYTTESGAVGYARPTEYYYYDRAGRLVGTRDANGHLTTRHLLAGTGHDGSGALVTYEYHPDGGYLRKDYDMFGDNRVAWDEIGRRTDMAYDAMGRVTQITRPNGLIDYFGYDQLGQKTSHWNNLLADREYTDYDLQGRVTRQVAFGGDTTTTSYSWNSAIATSGMGTFGGWTETTTMANGKSSTEQTDVFGRQVYRSDLGGHVYNFSYDLAGRMTQRTGTETLNYTWLNTGKVAQSFSATGVYGSQQWSRKGTTYGYDASGNLTSERFADEGHSYYEYWDQYYGYQYSDYSWSTISKNATATYDGLNRMVTWAEAGSTSMASASTGFEYDLTGNIRRSNSLYRALDQNGVQTTYNNAQDNWYRYDSMNRLVTKGSLVGGQIVRGYGGADYLYDKAGQRVSANLTTQGEAYIYDPYGWDPYYGGNQYMLVYYDAETREDYSYDAGGVLTSVRVAQGGYTDNYDGTLTVHGAPAYAQLRASYTNDLMGRVTHQTDWLGDGAYAGYDRSVTYNGKGQVTNETVVSKQGADTITTYSTHDYGYGSNYALGAVTYSSSSTYKNGAYYSASSTNTGYVWFESALQSSISTTTTTYSPNYSVTTHTTTLTYDGSGSLSSIYVGDGRPRSITFVNDANGQTIKRDESDNNWNQYTGGDPHEIWHRFGGKQMGYVGNNGTLETDYATSITNRTRTPGNGAFRFGTSYGTMTANFDLSNEAITSYSQGVVAGGYTVRQGDTLESIAASLWGDSSLWYKLAAANGMSAPNGLSEGQRITIPAGVMKSHHNASTFRPFDPSETLGDISPTTPQPQKAAAKRGGKCGVFGMILLVVIAVAVTVVTSGAALAALSPGIGSIGAGITAFATGVTATGAAVGAGTMIAAGAIGGALGSIASQGFGVATGIQEKFNWKGVALAAVGGAVSAGMGPGGLFGKAGAFGGISNGFVSGALRGAASSVVTQGVGVATGLQKKFDWAGVAVAGVSGGVSTWVGGKLPANMNRYVSQSITGAAGAIAGAATRSLVEGTDFGDNLLAALPDVIGNTLGSLIADAVTGNLPKGQKPEPQMEPDSQAMDGDGFVDEFELVDGLAMGGPLADLGEWPPAFDDEDLFPIGFDEFAPGAGDNLLTADFRLASVDPFQDPWLEEQMRPYTLEGIFEGLRDGINQSVRDRYNRQVRAQARRDLEWAINNPNTSPLAREVLRSFLTGTGPREFHYGPGSAGINELFGTAPGGYFRREEIEAMRYMAYSKYRTGELRNGYTLTQYTYRDFNPLDGLSGIRDGIHLGDITGTWSSGLSATVRGDRVYFRAENSMNLVSYAGGNLLPIQRRYIDSPSRGPLSPVRMVFEWSRPIPPYLRPGR